MAKDSTIQFLWLREFRPIYPIEIQLAHTKQGAPLIQGQHVGIDIEKIEPLLESFEDVSLTPDERALLPKHDREEWITRFWCAKEAVAKARRTGMAGKPKRFVIREVSNERLLVDRCWVRTALEGEHIVAWTEVE